MLKLATLFSGIGAIEQAFKRLGIPHKIVFACDNGDISLPLLEDSEQREYERLVKLRSKKQLKKEVDILRLNELNKLELTIAEQLRHTISLLPNKCLKKQFVDSLYATKTRQCNFVKTTYLSNYSIPQEDFHLDVRFLDGTDYTKDEIDLLVGGSPCQSFSTVGAQHGLNDARGTLFYDFARIILETQPKAFIYENVKGLMSHDNGRTWETMLSILSKSLNYDIPDPEILNASDYGIPQSRRRVFVIGFRKDISHSKFSYPTPVPLRFTMQDFLEDNCAYGNFNYDTTTGSLVIVKSQGHPHPKFTLTPGVQKYVLATGTKNYKTSIETDLPIARTLMKMMTQHHRAGVDNYITVQKDPLILRQLTDREALRLMGFTDDFKIAVSSTQTLRQAGNSIVVDVLMELVKQIFKTGIFNYDKM